MTQAAWAQSAVSLRMVTSQSTVNLGDTFQLDVILNVDGQDAVDELELPDLTDFVVLREGESQHASFAVKAGRRAIVVEHRRTFVLRAAEAGTKEIGVAKAVLGNATARAAPITITVVGKTTPPPTKDTDQPAGARPLDELPSVSDEPGARFGDALPRTFLELRVDKTRAVVGEQITASAEVYSLAPLGQYPRVPGPKPPGFVCLPIDDGLRLQASQRIIKGKSYYVYPLNRDALFATKAGQVVIEPFEIEVSPSGSFFSRGQDLRLRSGSVTLDIVEPPPTPAGFVAENVGRAELRATARPNNVKVGEPFTVVVEVVGWGNVAAFAAPQVPDLGEHARLFPPSVRRERRDKDGLIAGRIVEETLVQMQKPGRVTIPALTLVVFDPAEQRYVTRTTQPLHVNVSGAAGAQATTGNKRQTIAIGTRPLMTGGSARALSRVDAAPQMGASVFGVCATIAGVVRLRQRRRVSTEGRVRERRKQRALRAQHAQAKDDFAALSAIVLEAVAERCGDDVRAADNATLRPLLHARGLDEATANDTADALIAAEAARYAPGGKRQQASTALMAVLTRLDA